MSRALAWLAATGIALSCAGVAGAALRAEQITAASADELLIGGPDAIGGVGDWYLANDVVEVIVDDPGRRFGTLGHGGTIVDAGLRELRDEDQFARLWPLVNLSQRVLIGFDTIRAEVDPEGGFARLVVSNRGGLRTVERGGTLERAFDPLVPTSAELSGVVIETEFRVQPGEAFVRIATEIRNESDRAVPIFAYGDVWMRGGRSTRAWVGNTLEPERSRGFHHRSFDRTSILTASEAFAAFTHVSVPGMRDRTPIAYALDAPERARRGLVQFGVTGQHVTFVNAFVGDPPWRELTLWRLLRQTLEELGAGESWTFRRRLTITDRASVAATTDAIFPELDYADGHRGLSGRVEPADVPVGVLVRDAATGAPVTHILTAPSGAEAGVFRALLPAGDYELELRAPHRANGYASAAVTAGRTTELPVQRLPQTGWLRFEPAFADGGPGRVIAVGAGGTPDPVFAPELLDFRIDGRPGKSGSETRELHFVGNDRDPGRVEIAPGTYRLVATRGLEHDVAEVRVEVAAGAEVRVPPFALARVVSLPGWVSADFHVHAEASDDSGMSNEARLRSFAAEGVDVLVSTDHDHLGHFESALDWLGLRERLRVVQGVEVTSSGPSEAAPWTIGHHNAWPIPYVPTRHRKGAPPSQNQRVAELYAALRSEYGAEVIQLNHPRASVEGPDEGAFLSHLGSAGEAYDPSRSLAQPPNDLLLEPARDGTRGIDFDAIEVMNGKPYGGHPWLAMRRDWYSLLRQGLRRAGTANSDTHGPGQLAAYPRNYVELGAEPWSPQALDRAILAGRLFGTTGPLITRFEVNGAGLGADVTAEGGRVTVSLRVEAAPWVPVDEVRVLANGETVHRFADLPDLAGTGARDAPPGGESAPAEGPPAAPPIARLDTELPLSLPADAFITIEAGASLDIDPAVWMAGVEERGGLYADVVAPGFVSIAFTNPIYVDVGGDGRFDLPGPFRARESGTVPSALLFALAALLAVGLWRWRASRQRSKPAS